MATGEHIEEIVWMEIPPMQIALAQCLALAMFLLLLKRDGKDLKWRVSVAVYTGIQMGILCAVFYWLSIPHYLFVLIGLALMTVFAEGFTRAGVLLSFYIALCAFIASETASGVYWLVNIYPMYYGFIQVWLPYVVMGVTYVIIFSLLLFLFKSVFTPTLLEQIKLRDVFNALGLAAILYFSGNISIFAPDSPIFNTTSFGMFQMRALVSIISIAVLYAYQSRLADVAIMRENEQMKAVLQAQYDRYRAYEDSMEFIRIKNHDLKHQIEGLRAANDSEQRKKWINALEQELEDNELLAPTGNAVLDSILMAKLMLAINAGIRLTCVVDGGLLDFLEVTDLCTIFGNALDNAIEACSRVEDLEKRIIHLTVTRQKQFVLLMVENYCEVTPQFGKDGFPKTTKQEMENHGLGLKSIRYALAKYGGTITVEAVNGWFRLRGLVPKG